MQAAMDYAQVLDEVYVGACPDTHEQIGTLKYHLGVTAVLNLQTDEDMERLGHDWRKLSAHYRREKIKVCRVPMRDFDAEDLRKNLPRAVQVLGELLRQQHTVYVHCTAGLGRSPSVVIAYMSWVQQRELDDAAQFVTRCRPSSPNVEAVRLAGEDLWGD